MTTKQTIRERDQALQGFAGQTLPGATEETIGRADQIAGGTVFFYGRTPVQVGLKGIDWSGGHIKHQEWPAQLNRFFHLAPLAAAYRKTKDEKYATAARAYIEDWMVGEDYSQADRFRPGDSGLNMSIRLGSSEATGWAGCLPAFLDSPAFDDAFLTKLTESLARQAGFLADHLTALANWRISELDSLVFTALRLPFLPNAKELLGRGILGMRNALATQFLPDGVHIERTPGYHSWMARVGVNYLDLARRFPEADAHVDPELVARALDYDAHSALSAINDAGLAPRDPERFRAVEARQVALRRIFPDHEIEVTPPETQVFPAAGQVFVRSSWKPGGDALAFDASTWGGGHGHLSRNSFSFRAGGRLLIADPGILNYEMSDPLGPYGKSTPAHSTLNLEGRNQSAADGRLLRTDFTPDTALIYAQYDGGYWEGRFAWGFDRGRGQGVYGEHRRLLFWVRGEYLLCLDQMQADPGTSVRNCWQMGPMEAWTLDREALSWRSQNGDENVFLQLALAPANTEVECFEGSREPLRGWIGSHGNDSQPAPLVEFRYPARGGATTSAVLIVPVAGREAPRYTITRRETAGPIHHVELTTPAGATDHLAWSTNLEVPIEDAKPVVSDATLVWLRTDAKGVPAKAYLFDGSYVRFADGTVVESGPRRTQSLTFGGR